MSKNEELIPLIIVKSDSQIADITTVFQEKQKQWEDRKKFILKQVEDLDKDQNEAKREYWSQIESALLEKKLIDSKDVSLSLRDGVIYLDKREKLNSFGDLLKRLFE